MDEITACLGPTPTIDCDNAAIREKAQELTKGQQEVTDKARSLFYFVRDQVRFNSWVLSDKPEYFRASRVLETREGYCMHKAILLAALARASGLPARLHVADIRNHLAAEKVRELIRGNIFRGHTYDELHIEGRWIKVAPTFDLKMCQDFRLVPVEFDGQHDALLPAYNQNGKPHIEYVNDLGCYEDFPFEMITARRLEAYGADFFEKMGQAIAARKGT